MEARLLTNNEIKAVFSPVYNYVFRKGDGFFARWGKAKQDDPSFAPFGPELLDISITSKCFPGSCKYCYQNAKHDGVEMSVATMCKILDAIPQTVCQIALGGGEPTMHSQFCDILKVIRDHDIVPNYTTNGYNLTDEIVKATVRYCGAVATSYHGDWSVTMDSVNRFSAEGMVQTNVHFVLSESTIDEAIDLMHRKPQDGFENINAIIFLLYKPQGRAPASDILCGKEKIQELFEAMQQCQAFKIGFDSCSVPMLYHMLSAQKDIEMLNVLAEPCESSLFSYYIDVDCMGYPCSFCKNHVEPVCIDVENEKYDFLRNTWYHMNTNEFRSKSIHSTDNCKKCAHKTHCRRCVVYPDIIICDNK